jgi:hypothetical protein
VTPRTQRANGCSLTIYLLTSAIGGIIGGGFSALGSAASAAGSGLSNAVKPLAQAAGVEDAERAAKALKGLEVKRLMYNQPREGAHA